MRRAIEQEFEFLIVWPSDGFYPFYRRAGFRRRIDPLVFNIDESYD